jgi:Holliday junction resolvasome RuvABC endonuclease subunit
MIILSIDPSLTATGLGVVETAGDTELVRAVGFVATKPDTKSRHVYQADKDGARIDEIADVLLALLELHRPDVVACEAPAGSQHANSAKALALAYGTIRGVLRARDITPIMVQAHHAKHAATGDKAATKEAVITAMQARFAVQITGSKARREAIADALSVACAAMNEPTVQAMRRRDQTNGRGESPAQLGGVSG